MRILIPNHPIPDSFVDNVAFTLREMGHEVLTIPFRSENPRFRTLKRIVQDTYFSYYPSKWNYKEKWLLSEIRTGGADLVLCLTQALQPEVLAEIKNLKVLTVVWWGDCAANMTRQGILSEYWDAIFIKDKYAHQKLLCLGLNSYYMHEAMNPHWHKPLSGAASGRVAVAGSYYGYRNALVVKMMNAGVEFDLYGAKPPRWAPDLIKHSHRGKYIVKEEKSRIFGNSMLCLNSTAMREFNSMNCRAFEIAGCGGLQLMENRECISECFDPSTEILVFDTWEEAVEIVERVQSNPSGYTKVRENAVKRSLSEHTYQHRLNKILRTINEL